MYFIFPRCKIKDLVETQFWLVDFVYYSLIDFISYGSLHRSSKLFCGRYVTKLPCTMLKLKCFDLWEDRVGRADKVIWFSFKTVFKMGNFKNWNASDSGWLQLILHSSLELTRSVYRAGY